MPELLVHPLAAPQPDGTILSISPASAGWEYVGFEVLRLTPGVVAARATGERELCLVVLSGSATVSSRHGEWHELGGRPDPFSGPPEAAYLPPQTELTVRAEGAPVTEVALCWAPAPGGGATPRVLSAEQIEPQVRGFGTQERTIHPILLADREAASLLVSETLTPAGHWSSYPPHKHDRDDPPGETLLEETYYQRISPAQGFGLQRVYTGDGALDEAVSFADGDCVLVPRGYHTVSAPPGYELYYLNVMAGPRRQWAVADDPAHAWRAQPPS